MATVWIAVALTMLGYGSWYWEQAWCRRQAPGPRLALALAAALATVYVLAGVMYLLALPRPAYLVSLLPPIWLLWRHGPSLWRRAHPAARWMLAMTVTYSLWVGLLSLAMPIPGGGNWAIDWVEHFNRSQFFLEHWNPFREDIWYRVTARPPLMNLVTAYYMSFGPDTFTAYQSVALWLNSLIAVPVLVAATYCRRPTARWLIVLVLFTMPFIIWNTLYPWTRGLSNSLILGAMLLYVRQIWRPRRETALAAFILLALAALTHYSAGPYIAVAVLHWCVVGLRRLGLGHWLRQTLVIGAVCAAMLATWFVPAITTYGWRETFGSNSSVTEVASMGAESAIATKMHNLYVSFVPHLLRAVPSDFSEPSTEPLLLIDLHSFMLLQTNVVGMMGPLLLGALLLLWPVAWGAATPAGRSRLLQTTVLAVALALLGLLVVGESHLTGAAHLCLQPLLLAVAIWVAARAASKPVPRLLVLVSQLLAAAALAAHLATLVYIHDLYVLGRVNEGLLSQSFTLRSIAYAPTLIRKLDLTMISDNPWSYLPFHIVALVAVGAWYGVARRRTRQTLRRTAVAT